MIKDANGQCVTPPPTPTSTASLGDYVWVDINKNGIQDPGEIGVPGVKVYLYKLSSCGAELTTPLRTTTTDSNGKYDFSSLEPGIYKVRFELPYGYDFTNASQ